MKKRNLILILARGGSKKISKQNLRLVAGKPLLYYVLTSCLRSKSGDVYVSTDSNEIKEVSILYGGKVINRPKNLAQDLTTLADMAAHAISYLKKENVSLDKCLILSPIFPLLSINTIRRFFSYTTKNRSTLIGFTKDVNEIYRMTKKSTQNPIPLSTTNTNVVKLKKIVCFNVSEFLKNNDFAKPDYGLEIPPNEGITINDYHDLNIIEEIIERKRILVRVDGNNRIGLGHVYNMLTILNHFRNDEILVVMDSGKRLGDYLFKQQLYKVKLFTTQKDFEKIISNYKPDVIFNDILDTDKAYMKRIKKFNSYVVNFEDLGPGNNFADLVFNPIYYSNKISSTKKFFGEKYACVRDEFRIWYSKTENKHKKSTVLITFGGSDPKNLTTKILQTILDNQLKLNLILILGSGFNHKTQILKLVKKMQNLSYNIKVLENANLFAKNILDSDFVITANGRTVFEVVSLFTPFITISANSREEKHMFSRYSRGGIHLGLHSKLSDKKIVWAINKMKNKLMRKKLNYQLKNFDLLSGVYEVVKIINTGYNKYKNGWG